MLTQPRISAGVQNNTFTNKVNLKTQGKNDIGTLVIEIAEKTFGTSTYKNLTCNKI